MDELDCLMDASRVAAIRRLLEETLEAHGNYETTELGGVYDEAWADWYATYLLDHGLADQLPDATSLDSSAVSAALSQLNDAYRREQPDEDWPPYYAKRLGGLLR